ncbi:MAG: Nif3-like dinuclear metal center hexameric protein [Bacteroidota bacterium]
MSDFTSNRRQFIRTASLGLAAAPFLSVTSCQAANLTIAQVIEQIIAQIPGGKRAETVDTLKIGDPKWAVKGIATTFMATIPVIEKAAAAGLNFIITHEPTFYNHLDETDWLADDPVYQHKKALLEKHQIAVWRFHDYWHRYEPDGILTGFLQKVGWEAKQDPTNNLICQIDAEPLEALASGLAERLSLSRTFYIGDPTLSCARVGVMPGSWGKDPHIELLREDIDVLVIGECNEWETSEYVRDAAAAGIKKGLIILGHAESEEPGMAYCRDWLNEMFPKLEIVHVPAGDAFSPAV